MGHPIVTSLTTVAAVANGYALSQSRASAGSLTLNGSLVAGGVGKPDVPRRVIVTSAGNDSAITFTITGTARPEQGGIAQSETITGANAGIAASTQDFATVTSISSSAATASTVTAGTNGTASGPWVPWDLNKTDFQVSAAGNVLSGTPIWQVDYTQDDVFGTWLPASVPFPRAIVSPALQAKTIAADGAFTIPVRATRLTLTAVGGVMLTQAQQGVGI